VEGSQTRRAGAAGHLPGKGRRSLDEGCGGVRGGLLGQRYPAIALNWRRNGEQVVPFFAFPESVRRIHIHHERH